MKRRVLVTALTMLISGGAFALTDQEIVSGIQFSFNNPGARSLGMGGAFLGFSDDATAAYTNPAGLTALTSQEVALEVRRFGYDVEYVSGGSAQVGPDNFSGLQRSTASDDQISPSFISYVYPGETWALAIYRQVATDYSNSFVRDNLTLTSPTFRAPGQAPGTQLTVSIFALAAAIELEVENYGVSGAFDLNEQWSFGASAIYSSAQIAARTLRSQGFTEVIQGDDDEFVLNLGALYRVSDSVSIGAAYRHGAAFDLRFGTIRDPRNPQLTLGNTDLKIPHQIGVGVAWRPTDSLSVGLEANHIRYSRLADNFQVIAFEAANQGLPGGRFDVDDGTEVRLGAEYVFLNMNRPFILRAGVWRDPDHRLRYDSPRPASNIVQAASSVLFPAGDDEIHYALGFGWAFESFQLDAAADFSDLADIYSVSGVYRF